MASYSQSCSIFVNFAQVYINYVNLVVNLLIPTAVLSVMNCLIYKALLQNQVQGNQVRTNCCQKPRPSLWVFFKHLNASYYN